MDTAQRFVDSMGRAFADGNAPEIAGRIFGWLIIADTAEQTVEQIMEGTGASRASVSTMTRFLETAAMIERAPTAKDRRTRYRIGHDPWGPYWMARVVTYGRMRDVSVAAKKDIEADGGEPNERLEQMVGFFEYLRAKFLEIMEEWPRLRPEAGNRDRLR
jgi:DNA-binding transcriptional regulator GbsR (MarR family)